MITHTKNAILIPSAVKAAEDAMKDDYNAKRLAQWEYRKNLIHEWKPLFDEKEIKENKIYLLTKRLDALFKFKRMIERNKGESE